MPNKTVFQRNQPALEFTSALVLGLVVGYTPEVKFGYAASISVQGDITPLGVPYVFPVNTGQEVEAISNNAADTHILRIVVIDAGTGLERTEEVTLNGNVGPVAIPGGPVLSVNRAYNNNGTPYVGTISIRGTGAPNANVFATILPEDQQTTQCPYMVPADKVGIINNYSTAINKSGGADVSAIMRLVVTRLGKVPRTQIRYGLQRGGVSNISSDLVVPIPVPPGARIQVTGDPSAVADISGEYSMQLIDKTLISAEVLLAIEEG